jgi:hypothetical protein
MCADAWQDPCRCWIASGVVSSVGLLAKMIQTTGATARLWTNLLFDRVVYRTGY